MYKVEIDLGFAKLVAEQGDPAFREVCVGIVGPHGDYQDIALIGQNYNVDNNCDIHFKDNVLVRVWADKEWEDYTDSFEIGLAENFK